MLFNSVKFIFVFLPIALVGYQLAGMISRKAPIHWLTLISLVFYASWRSDFLALLLGSACFNYGCAFLICKSRGSERKQTALLAAAICGNLFALCYFKYLFPALAFLHEAGVISSVFGSVILPLGISFFTFTQIGYLVDLKQDSIQLGSFFDYLFFVTFFPHLIAGPILHHSEIMPQLASRARSSLKSEDLAAGLSLFVIGLFKKVALADTMAPMANLVFANPEHSHALEAWRGVLSYAMQLYFDFSGYSDMAIGLAYMFSIKFPINFNSPYKARSIIDFWQRWHMTLTRYLTMYLYNPISLSLTRRSMKRGKRLSSKGSLTAAGFVQRILFPTLTTMSLAGIWHGAGLQFLIFGVLHGCYLSINHAWRIFGGRIRSAVEPFSAKFQALVSAVSVLLVFAAVLVGQIYFRASSAQAAGSILAGMGGLHEHLPPARDLGTSHFQQAALLLLCFAIVWFCPNSQQILQRSGMFLEQPLGSPMTNRYVWRPNLAWASLVSVLFLYCLTQLTNPSEFLYFQF